MDFKKLTKPLILLALIIILFSVLARVFSGPETLHQYAEKNPDIAYQKKQENDALTEEKQTENSSTGQASVSNNSNDDITINNSNKTTIMKETEHEEDIMTVNADRIEYKPGFYYEPLSEEMKFRITGISYPVVETDKDNSVVEAINIVSSPEDIRINYEDLRYLSVLYYNFKGIERVGELICNKAIAQDLVEIFHELYISEYQIEQIHLIDEYNGDDTLSMQDNNTSCFNYRVVDGTTNLSKHALGLAIDINPFFNPYVVYKNDGTTYISPQGSEVYADRSNDFAYKIDENDLCYKLFKEHGFTWGGDWNSLKDYQHFQKVIEE